MKIKILRLTFIMSLITLCLSYSYAQMESAYSVLSRARGSVNSYPQVARLLANDGLYFTSTAYLKEYLVRSDGRKARNIDALLDEVISQIGVKQFDVMPINILKKSHAPTIYYILAKKHFRYRRYNEALNTLNTRIPANHPTKPFALLLEGSAFAVLGKTNSAKASFRRCIDVSDDFLSQTTEPNRMRQLSINKDYCIVGIPRSDFAAKKYESANSMYLDLPKESYIWPEVLFEEAWNSFYLRDYNRTLGKLVTYKAPVLDYVFNPETDVLRSLTYMELCLFDDAGKVVDDFYQEYESDSTAMKKFLAKYGRNYKYYYLMMKSKKLGKRPGNKLLNNYLDYLLKDAAFVELLDNFNRGRNEIQKIKTSPNRKLKRIFLANLKQALLLQRDLIGAYVRKTIIQFTKELEKTFEGMSYIKLEILARKKDQIYNTTRSYGFRSRGDVKNIQRTDKQYFWTFNGEFWADELGDYVFSLKSECRK
jgi:hypothetical protein